MKIKHRVSAKIQAVIDEPHQNWGEKEAALQAEFGLLIHDDFINALLIERLSEIRDYKDDKSEFVGKDIILARGPTFAVSLRLASESKKTDLASNSDIFFIAALDQPLTYRRFLLDDAVDLNIFTPDIQLAEQPVEVAPPMSVVKFSDPKVLFEIEVSHPTKIIRLVINRPRLMRASLLWSFSRQTLRPLGVSANEFKDTAMVHACEVLTEFDDDSSLAPLQELATSASAHFVRWAAIKSLASIDADKALEIVQHAKFDSHPHIRSAAISAEQQLS
ncbi:HEAT repeat domain-containing protein [Duganella sp. BuS-21]|uniref:HEAT repeat domain-containing protein n=1 Tax=Duganella sp. BuS-21 TaxID=2943848 RepID=UPI0035A5D7F9